MKLDNLRQIHFKFLEELGINRNIYKEYSITNNETIKDSPVWIAEHFDEKYNLFWNHFDKFIYLKDIADILVGIEQGSIDYIEYFDIEDSDVPFIKTSELANFEINQTAKHFLSKEKYLQFKQDVKKGDLLYSKDGKVGQIAIILEDLNFVFSSGLIRIRIKENKFKITNLIVFLLLSMKEFGLYFVKKYTVTGTTIPHLNIEYIKNMKIPILDNKLLKKYHTIVSDFISK